MAATWTDARIETLTQLWKDGASASQIARDLGGVTRNAVIGKIHRLGLARGGTPFAPGARRAKPKGERRLRRALSAPVTRWPDAPPPAARLVAESGLATVVSVGNRECRWPIGDPRADGFCLCGRSVARGAYCGEHGAVAYRETPRDHLLKLAGLR